MLLAAEGVTIPFVGAHLVPHFFIGLMLVPPVLLKLASTGWRFARYYLHDPAYVARGTPHAILRFLVAPFTVASTLGLFGSGVLLAVLHPQRGLLLTVHKASFIVWVGAMTLHVLAHVPSLPRLLRADLVRGTEGARLRQFAVACALVAGLIAGIAGIPPAHQWAALAG